MSGVTLSQRECNGTLAVDFPAFPELGQGERSIPPGRARDGAMHGCRHTVRRGVRRRFRSLNSRRFPSSGKGNGRICQDGPGNGPCMGGVTLPDEECDGILAARFLAVPALGQGERSLPPGRTRVMVTPEWRHTGSVTGLLPHDSQPFLASATRSGRIRRDGPATRPCLGAVALSHKECDGTLAAKSPGFPTSGKGQRSNLPGRTRDRAMYEWRHTVTRAV